MSFLFAGDAHWGVANWASHAFFRDTEPFLAVAPSLAEDIRFCIDSETDTVDLREADAPKIKELIALIDRVIAANRVTQGKNFA